MGKIWEIYDELLALRQAGVSVSDIEEKLNSKGFNLQPGNLTSYMYQIKKKKEKLKLLDQPATFILENQSAPKTKPKTGGKTKRIVIQNPPAPAPAAAPNTKENDKNQDPLKITGQNFFDGISDTPTKTPEIEY